VIDTLVLTSETAIDDAVDDGKRNHVHDRS